MRWWIPLAALGSVVIVILVVSVVLLSVQDVSKYKDFITRKASEKTGRELVIAGDFDLSISFSPSIFADDVSFQNAEWGSEPEMLKLGHVEAEVALFPMLFGDIKINRLIMEDLDLLVETNAESVGNWEFGERKDAEHHDEDEEYGGDGGTLPVIDEMRIDNALMRFQAASLVSVKC